VLHIYESDVIISLNSFQGVRRGRAGYWRKYQQ